MKKAPFIIERTYNAPVEKVWRAITDRDQMEQWYFKIQKFKPEVGFEFRFRGGPDDRIYLHICVITEVIHCKKLTHSWRYDAYAGQSYVSWKLFDKGNKTTVKLTHSGLETFPKEPDFASNNFATGWADILGRGLKEYLEKN